jgi:hypothetical protein
MDVIDHNARFPASVVTAASGQKRRSVGAPTTSGPPLLTDILRVRRHVSKVPTAVREIEALWRALINLVPEPANAPERQSFELLRNECPYGQRD